MTKTTKRATASSIADGTKPLPQEVANFISKKIHDNELPAGAQLPSERELGETLGVSRAVVREALARLKSEGLIEVFHGRGAYVANLGERRFFEFSLPYNDSDMSREYMFELMNAIEVSATRLAALRRTEEELKTIKRALFGMEYAISMGRLGDEEDYSFHKAIVESTHNPNFIELSEYLENRFRRIIRQARSNTAERYKELIEAVQIEHQDIFDAIKAQDPERAAQAAETHLRNAARRLRQYSDS